MAESIATAVIDVKANTTKLKNDFRTAQKSVSNSGQKVEKNLGKNFKQVNKSAKSTTGSLLSLKSALGAIAVAGLTKGTLAIVNYGSKMSDLADQAGLTTDEFQGLNAASAMAGVSSDKMVGIMAKISQSMAKAKEGVVTYTDAYDKIGITADDLNTKSPQEILERIAVASRDSARGSEEFGAVLEIIGTKNAPKFIEVLREVADVGLQGLIDRAREAGLVIDKDLIKKLDEAADSMEVAKLKATSLGATLIGWVSKGAAKLGELGVKSAELKDEQFFLQKIARDNFKENQKIAEEEKRAEEEKQAIIQKTIEKRKEEINLLNEKVFSSVKETKETRTIKIKELQTQSSSKFAEAKALEATSPLASLDLQEEALKIEEKIKKLKEEVNKEAEKGIKLQEKLNEKKEKIIKDAAEKLLEVKEEEQVRKEEQERTFGTSIVGGEQVRQFAQQTAESGINKAIEDAKYRKELEERKLKLTEEMRDALRNLDEKTEKADSDNDTIK